MRKNKRNAGIPARSSFLRLEGRCVPVVFSRWTLEIFIRFFKQILGCRHLLSTKPEGIEIQIYAAIICCMLLNILTGSKPNKWMLTLMSLYLAGWASDNDVRRELNKPNNKGIKLRAKDELWKKLGVD